MGGTSASLCSLGSAESRAGIAKSLGVMVASVVGSQGTATLLVDGSGAWTSIITGTASKPNAVGRTQRVCELFIPSFRSG